MPDHPVPTLTTDLIRLAAVLLRLAAHEFTCHGCNDFTLADVPGFQTADARRRLAEAFHAWNGDPEEYDPTAPYTYHDDVSLMSLCAAALEQAAGVPRAPTPEQSSAEAALRAEDDLRAALESEAFAFRQAEDAAERLRQETCKRHEAEQRLRRLREGRGDG